MRKIIPLILILIGIGSGVGAGLILRPVSEPVLAPDPCGEALPSKDHGGDDHSPSKSDVEYVKLSNQFVVPVVSESLVEALIVVSLSVEVSAARKDEIYTREPKLRDAFLQVLFDHANMGGFKGRFTESGKMSVLRRALLETAQDISTELISDVLIVEMARQDI